MNWLLPTDTRLESSSLPFPLGMSSAWVDLSQQESSLTSSSDQSVKGFSVDHNSCLSFTSVLSYTGRVFGPGHCAHLSTS